MLRAGRHGRAIDALPTALTLTLLLLLLLRSAAASLVVGHLLHLERALGVHSRSIRVDAQRNAVAGRHAVLLELRLLLLAVAQSSHGKWRQAVRQGRERVDVGARWRTPAAACRRAGSLLLLGCTAACGRQGRDRTRAGAVLPLRVAGAISTAREGPHRRERAVGQRRAGMIAGRSWKRRRVLAVPPRAERGPTGQNGNVAIAASAHG